MIHEQDSENEKNIQTQRNFNPVVLAMQLGFGGALDTCIGAAIRKNSVHDESIIVLTGGCILGFCLGILMMLVPVNSENRLWYTGSGYLFNFALSLLAPYVGLQILKSNMNYNQLLTDYFIGFFVTLAALIPLLCCSDLFVSCLAWFAAVTKGTPPMRSVSESNNPMVVNDDV
jgi:hypothetical protein